MGDGLRDGWALRTALGGAAGTARVVPRTVEMPEGDGRMIRIRLARPGRRGARSIAPEQALQIVELLHRPRRVAETTP